MKEIAIYLRLSKADKERTRESQSIQNQRALLYKAIREDASLGNIRSLLILMMVIVAYNKTDRLFVQ